MRRSLGLGPLLLFAATSAAAATLPTLFYKAKEQFRLANYTVSLETLGQLQAEVGQARQRGVSRAARTGARVLSRRVLRRARPQRRSARELRDVSRVHAESVARSVAVSARVITALDETKKSMQQKKPEAGATATASSPASPAETGSFAAAYRAFKPTQPQGATAPTRTGRRVPCTIC